MTIAASLRSELLKMKRTSLIYLVLITALLIPMVMIFDHGSADPKIPAEGWEHYYRPGTSALIFVFLPVFFVLASTLMMQVEVRNNTWKQVLASPQLFFDILLAKFIVLQLLGLGFVLIYNIYMLLGAAAIDAMEGTTFIDYIFRWQDVIQINVLAYGSTFGISAFSFWMALRAKNFIVPIAVGLLLWLAGPTAAFEFHWEHVDKYFFAIPFAVIAKKYENEQLFHQLLSVAYGMVFFIVAYLEFLFQRVSVRRLLGNKVPAKSALVNDRIPEELTKAEEWVE